MRAQWYGKARESGFRDIEAPSGIIARRAVRDDEVAEHAQAAAFLHSHTFATDFDRDVWELHAEGVRNRGIARRLQTNRQKVDRVILRLTAVMVGAPARSKGGRPRDPEGLRSEGMWLGGTLLDPRAALALDHIRAVLNVSAPEAVRRALPLLARVVSSATKPGE